MTEKGSDGQNWTKYQINIFYSYSHDNIVLISTTRSKILDILVP